MCFNINSSINKYQAMVRVLKIAQNTFMIFFRFIDTPSSKVLSLII